MNKNNYLPTRQELINVYRTTMNAVEKGAYTTDDGTVVELDDDSEMQENSRLYSHKFTVNDVPAYPTPTLIAVENTDSISAGKHLLDEGYRPAVLNFASRTHAGGGVMNGSRAQEESLFRQTTLFRSLYQFTPNAENFGLSTNRRQYPMDREFGGVYTPYATVFRTGDREGNKFLTHPFKLSFISVAAINHPALVDDNGNEVEDNSKVADCRIAPRDVATTLNKMRTIFRIGLSHGHDALVLGAFGCGAFANPPLHIAQLFKQVMEEREFKNKYRKIVFAVIEDHNSRNHNLLPFLTVFGK